MGDIREEKEERSLMENIIRRGNYEGKERSTFVKERIALNGEYQKGNDIYWKDVEDENKRSLMGKIRKDDCEGKEGGS